MASNPQVLSLQLFEVVPVHAADGMVGGYDQAIAADDPVPVHGCIGQQLVLAGDLLLQSLDVYLPGNVVQRDEYPGRGGVPFIKQRDCVYVEPYR